MEYNTLLIGFLDAVQVWGYCLNSLGQSGVASHF